MELGNQRTNYLYPIECSMKSFKSQSGDQASSVKNRSLKGREEVKADSFDKSKFKFLS